LPGGIATLANAAAAGVGSGPMYALALWPGLAAVFNLNHPARYVHWHFFQMSVSNIVVIVLMIVVFVLAIALPFPGAARRS
jgi:hypothetical protein